MPEINNESHNIVSTYDKLIRRTNNGSKYFNTFPPPYRRWGGKRYR